MTRRLLLWLFRRVVDIYFLSIEAVGTMPAPTTGGRLFVANHVNGLIDPLLVLTAAPCDISPVAKSTLWNIPGLRSLLDVAGAVPIVRRQDAPDKIAGANDEAFARVASWLADGGNILIFPEGVSHNEPYVLRVRSGAARMLVGAFRHGATEATFQAVALEFDARHVFRSRALIVYGPVRHVADVATKHTDDEAIISAISAQIQADLAELLVEGASWSERLLVARVAEMLAHHGGDPSLAGWNEIGRQVEAAHETLRQLDDARVAQIDAAVSAYHALLEREGLADVHVAAAVSRASPPLWLLLPTLPLAAIGVLIHWLPYQAPRWVAKTAREPDVVSTYKLGAGLLVFPLWAALWIALAFVWLPWGWSCVVALLVVVSPFATLLVVDRSRPLRRALRLRRSAAAEELRAARQHAMDRIDETRQWLERSTR